MEITQEQIDRLAESFKKLTEQIIDIFKSITEWFNKYIWPKIRYIIKNYIKYKKYIGIYNRTRSKRIRKKQLIRIRKKVMI